MFYRSNREVVSSPALITSQSETVCAEGVLTSNKVECCLTIDEGRALTGTWVIDEVRLSAKK